MFKCLFLGVMLNALPDQPLTTGQVESLETSERVHDTVVLCGIGRGDMLMDESKALVTQFILRTRSATHVFVYAAPDDEEHDGWFILKTYKVSGDIRYGEASDVAAEYSDKFGIKSYVEDYYGEELSEPAVAGEYTF